MAQSVELGRVRMKPVFAGSPVAIVYRISSVLKLVWSSTATETTHNIVSPYRTKFAGPSRYSPLPIEAPSTMTPGPTTPIHARPLGRGGSGSSARDHGSRPDLDSGAVIGDS